MTEDEFARQVEAMSVAFIGSTVVDVPGRRLIRIPDVEMTGGWSPTNVRAILVCDGWPEQRPRLLIGDELCRAGVEPQNFSRELLGGEAWFGFSFNAAYTADYPALVPVVRGWLARFDGRSD